MVYKLVGSLSKIFGDDPSIVLFNVSFLSNYIDSFYLSSKLIDVFRY